tara:strand:+ start:922 stop:1368 length:447 start_codon:yes stop_codon:yes gene_type:complete
MNQDNRTHRREFTDPFIGQFYQYYRMDFPIRIAQAATQILRANPRAMDATESSHRHFCVDAFLKALKDNPEEFRIFIHNFMLKERVNEGILERARIEENAIRSDNQKKAPEISRLIGDFGEGKKYKYTKYNKKIKSKKTNKAKKRRKR